MTEKHPFGDFVPENAKYFLLGSFATKPTPGYEWFYANGRNQFWPILEKVFELELKTKDAQQKLFVDLKMALSDVILECDRINNSSLDINLKNLVVNPAIASIIQTNNFEKIYFSSRFAENLFRRHFKEIILEYPNISLITLPSPSPRYAAMSKQDKITKYKEILPKLEIL